MADIVLGDLLRWQRDLTLRPPAGAPPDTGLDTVVSWAVTIRAAAPILPALRGGEIVILPPRVLDQLERTESLDRRDLVRTLVDQPISALMVDPEFGERPLPGVPLLVTSGAFPADAEPVINRLLTERRTDLYRLGSELSRVLSASSMSGAGLDALLDAAAQVANRRMLLLDSEGMPLAASSGHAGDPPISSLEAQKLLQTRALGKPSPVGPGGAWLAQPLLDDDRRSRRGALLLVECSPPASTEMERLVAVRTAEAVELLLGYAIRAGRATSERANREALVADLMLGRLISREAAEARARLLSLDPARPVRVLLFTSTRDDGAQRLRSMFPLDRRMAAAALNERDFAAIVPADARFESDWRELAALARSARAADESLILVASQTLAGPAHANRGLAQNRVLAGLSRCGALDGWLFDAGDHERLGVYSLLYALWSGPDDRAGGSRLMAAFAGAFLQALEDHDSQRDGALVATLAAYLNRGGALAETAEALGVHRNTLAYRLGRIAHITGRDLTEARTRFLFQLALAIRDLQRAADGA